MAAFINVGESNLKKNKYLNNNYKRTVLFLKKFEKIKINNFFFASTCAVDNNGKPPNSIYGLSKKLSENQLKYAANDVIHLFDLKKKLEKMLIREKRLELAHKIFSFIPSRVELDLLDWHDIDIFSH